MVKVTRHGQKRMKERSGLNLKSVDRIAKIVYEQGLQHNETTGRLNRWITKLYFTHKTGNSIRIHGDKAYIFANEVLITVIQVPNNLLSIVKADKKRKESVSLNEDAIVN